MIINKTQEDYINSIKEEIERTDFNFDYNKQSKPPQVINISDNLYYELESYEDGKASYRLCKVVEYLKLEISI